MAAHAEWRATRNGQTNSRQGSKLAPPSSVLCSEHFSACTRWSQRFSGSRRRRSWLSKHAPNAMTSPPPRRAQKALSRRRVLIEINTAVSRSWHARLYELATQSAGSTSKRYAPTTPCAYEVGKEHTGASVLAPAGPNQLSVPQTAREPGHAPPLAPLAPALHYCSPTPDTASGVRPLWCAPRRQE